MMGEGHMGNMGFAGSYGYSFGGLIGGLLILLVKLLMVVLVVAVVVGIFVWIKNNFFQNTNSQFIQSINKDPILRTISVVTIAIIGIVLLFALLGSFGQQGGMGFGGYSFSFGVNPMYSIAGLLSLLVKVLMFVLVVSLILAVIVYLKNQFDQGNLNLFGTGKGQGVSAAAGDVNNQQTANDNTNES